jgi:DME family drug/metabolite transporter
VSARDALRARRGLLLVSACGLLWGTIGPAVRVLQDDGVGTLPISFWRLVLATAVLLPLMGRTGLRSLRAQRDRAARILAVGVAFAVFQVTFFVAVAQVGVAVASLVTLGIAPVTGVVLESLRDRALPPARTVVVTGFAIVGLALVSLAGGADAVTAPRPVLGIVLSLVSGGSYAASTVVSGDLSRRLGPVLVTAATTAVALVVVAPFALAAGVGMPTTAVTVGGIAWLGVVTTVFAYLLFYAGLRTTPGSVAMVLTLLEPATAVVLAVVLLGEPVTVTGTVGTVVLLASVAVLYLGPQPARAPEPAPPPA